MEKGEVDAIKRVIKSNIYTYKGKYVIEFEKNLQNILEQNMLLP